MKKIILALLALFVLSQVSFAVNMGLIGGIRNGLAGGVQVETGVFPMATFRGALEAQTGDSSVVLYGGGKFSLPKFPVREPVSLGAGIVSYIGQSNSNVGLSLSLIFNDLFDSPLFGEVGIDFIKEGRLIAQVGYNIF